MGSCFDSSRNHQPIAFWMNHSGSSASLEAQPSIRSGARPFLVQGRVKTRSSPFSSAAGSLSRTRRRSAVVDRLKGSVILPMRDCRPQPSRPDPVPGCARTSRLARLPALRRTQESAQPRSLGPKRVRAKDGRSTPEAFVEKGLLADLPDREIYLW